jgi:antitoxin Phd
MTVYTYSEARQKLASLLEQAVKEGEVKIKRKDGQTFIIRPESKAGSPLDVEGIDLGITTAEIVQFIHEGRRTIYPLPQSNSE